jgi:hypothetical protein
MRNLIMSRLITLWASIASGWLLLASGLSAAEPTTKQPTAMEKMMPSDQVPKMRACEKMAMDEKIETAKRTRFIKDCMSK